MHPIDDFSEEDVDFVDKYANNGRRCREIS